MTDTILLSHVTDIVTAHVSNNSVPAAEVPGLIQSVYTSLAVLAEPAEPVEEPRTPAVSIRASVKPHAITCLECGAKLKMLKRHLTAEHNLTPDEYRARWALPADYPLVSAEYSIKRSDLAVQSGLGRKPAQAVAAKAAAPAKASRAPAKKPRKKLGLPFDALSPEPEAARQK